MDFPKTVNALRSAFNTGKTKDLKWRKSQLRALVKMFDEQEDVFVSALKQDLGKPKQESILMEIKFTQNLTIEAVRNIDKWVKDEPAEKSFVTLLDSVYCHYEPLGVVLIISPWNYPLQLTVAPLVGAIAAGNCAVIKPSEFSEATAHALLDFLPKYIDNDCFKVITGDVPVVQELLKIPFDHIFFTGSSNVGRIIASAAAKHLTPTTLELGGKCPVYIHEDLARNPSKLKTAVKRLIWGKLANVGQTCVAPDYILCHSKVKLQLIDTIKTVYKEFYSEDVDNKNIGRIISKRHFERLDKLLVTMPEEKCIMKGPHDASENLMGLHIYSDVDETDSVMQEEIFGPILPILTVQGEEEAVNFINKRKKPLSLYIFSNNDRLTSHFIEKTSSGSVCINDALVHLSVESLPFGGVGESGYGAYHGKYSFECFSHKKSILNRGLDFIGEKIGDFRYPPYNDQKANFGSKIIKPISLPFGLNLFKYTVIAIIFYSFGFASSRLWNA
uniref:Aldehyde dehydrogenase n=1 Tax=Lepeophtheirus salmonis TaxID=72036 RepID=C1BUG0_LEPSM|nr:Aldehyde dehydrogenase, dimeric NADP-preferring [Lepeophtheirus salmonis]